MTEEQIQQAVEAAQKARREFFADDPAVCYAIMHLCAKYNVEVRYGKHGADTRKEGDKYIFTLPKNTTLERDRYRMAHEFGHIILGHSVEDMRLDGGIKISDKDRQANIFAAEFLMPEKDFREKRRECGNDVENVAFWFGVTPSAAGVRMVMLGIEEGKR